MPRQTKDQMTQDEARALDKDELEMANAARYPTLGDLGHSELTDLTRRLRERRDRAADVGRRQRRAASGKGAPQGGAPASSGRGMGDKHHYLTAALRRVSAEMKKREGGNDQGKTQKQIAKKAMKLKAAAEENAPERPATRTKNKGMEPIPYTDQAPSGAFDHAGARPARERSNAR